MNKYFTVFFFHSETVTTPEKKVADSPVKEKKVPDSPAKVLESPVKEKAAENGSAKAEEEDDEAKENGASEEEDDVEDDVVEKEQNGDSKGSFGTLDIPKLTLVLVSTINNLTNF